MNCENCHSGIYNKPPDNHISYLVCSSCGAIKLTYNAQDYQEPMHLHTNGEDKLTIMGVFGGRKSHSRH